MSMPATSTSHFKYRAYVDGLRAVAILPVILFHAGIGCTGGYVGVDVFFVISGFLITGLILKDIDNGEFHITEFWERRVRRILPALSVVVISCLVAGWFLYFPQDYKQLGRSMIAQALLVSNFFFYSDANYFADGVDIKPLLHTWSLAVEEQFYLVFPFVLLLMKRFSRKTFVPVIALLGVGSFLLSVYCSYKHPRANFYFLPPRAWELLIGAFLAATPMEVAPKKWLSELLSLGGLLAILWAVFFYNSETRFPGATAILPCVGAALIIWANGHTLSVVGKLLASPPFVFIGLISYSLYLWHWPVLVFFKYRSLGQLPVMQGLLMLALSIVLAVLSWKYVETPFRKKIFFHKRPQIFAFGAATTALLLLAGLAVFKLQGVPSRIPKDALQYLESGNSDVATAPASGRELELKDALNGDFPGLGMADKALPVSLLVWGDSHAKVEMPVLDILCKEHSGRGVVASHPQTAPLVGYDSEGVWSLKGDSIPFNNAVIDYIRKNSVRDVLIIARWDFYIDADKGTSRLHDGLVATINALRDSGARIWIMRQVPKYPWNVPKALASAVMHGQDPESIGMSGAEYREESRRQDPIFDGLETKFPGVTVLDPTALFVNASGRCRVASGGKPLYWDADHVNVAGAMMLRPLFEPIFGANGKISALVQDKSGVR
jgi:peptidoglycan/LPS O-acetylase OafA/YrhL